MEYEIDVLNQKIKLLEGEYNYYLTNMKDITKQNEEYLQSFIRAYYPGSTIKSTPRENVIRLVLNKLYKDRIEVRKERDALIERVLNVAWLSVQDTIKILELFGIYYRTIKYGPRTLLVPQDFVLLNNTIDSNKLNEIVKRHLSLTKVKDSTVMSMYKKDKNGVSLNKDISIVTSCLLVDDLRGIPIYTRVNDNIALNNEIVNIFPYKVISFLECLIRDRLNNPSISFEESFEMFLSKSKKSGKL